MNIPKELGVFVIKYHFDELKVGLAMEEKELERKKFEEFTANLKEYDKKHYGVTK